MSETLTKAFAATERSYLSAKASIGQRTEAVMARGPSGGILGEPSGFRNARQQLDAFRSWVFAAIRPIANRIAAQPIRVGRLGQPQPRRSKAAEPTPLTSHPIYDLLNDPNDLQTGYGLMWATVASINLTGRAFWWLPDEEPQRLYMLPCSWVQGFTGTTRYQSWKVLPPGQGEPIEVPSERVVYFALPSPADPWGSVSPLQAAADAVNNDDDILRSQRAAFTRGIHPSMAIVLGKDANGFRPRLTAPQQSQIIEAVRRRWQGADKHNEPIILDGLIEDVKRISVTPSEMDWQSSAEAMKRRILEAFGVSPYVLGSSEPGSRAASVAAQLHLVSSTVNPLIRLMSEAMSEWLSHMFGGGIRVWIEPAVVDDADVELQRMQLAASSGVVGYNELRRFAGLPEQEEKGTRNALLSTVGGMTGAVQILSAVGQGVMAADSAARLLALFFELPDAEARRIVGDGTGSGAGRHLAATLGTLKANELRRLAGLADDPDLDGVIVGKSTTGNPSPLDAVIREQVVAVLGELGAGAMANELIFPRPVKSNGEALT